MREFSRHARQHPSLGRDIIALNGLSSDDESFWMAWKDAVLDIACDASDQSQLLTLIKKAVAALSGTLEGPRAVSILADLAKFVPNTLEHIIKNFESSFPYWKNPQSSDQLLNFTKNALQFSTQVPQLQERIIDLLTRKILIMDLSIRLDDVHLINNLELSKNHDNSTGPVDANVNFSGAGEKYAQEEKARELEESQAAQQAHSKQVRDYAEKIDSMILAMMEFIKQSGNTRELGLFVLISFEKHVLPSIKPKFTQILIFYCASIDNFVTDRLLGLLIAALFARDMQLSPSAPRNSSNNQIKAKAVRSTAAFLQSFLKTAKSLTEPQLKTVIELLIDWVGRKIEAMTHFSCNPFEISILASVLEVIFDVFINHPNFAIRNDPKLIEAFKLASSDLSASLKSQEIVVDYIEACCSTDSSISMTTTTTETVHPPKLPYKPFEYLVLPKSLKFLLDAQVLKSQ